MGLPYVEDYYYQAFVYKHYNRRNRRTFAPESGTQLPPCYALCCCWANTLVGRHEYAVPTKSQRSPSSLCPRRASGFSCVLDTPSSAGGIALGLPYAKDRVPLLYQV